MRFAAYQTDGFYDEIFEHGGTPRQGAQLLVQKIASLPEGEINKRQEAADRAFLNMGITFNVYGNGAGTEKIFPFDLIPRIIEAKEWEWIERGLKQRIYALNLFINDIYHDQKIIKDGIIPEHVIQVGEQLSRGVRGLESTARDLVPRHRNRSGAGWRRKTVCAGGQPALPVGRVVRSGKPERDEAFVPAGV